MHGTSPLAGLVLLEVVAMRRVVNLSAGPARLRRMAVGIRVREQEPAQQEAAR